MKKPLFTLLLLFCMSITKAHTCSTNQVKCPLDNTIVEFCVTASMTTSGNLYDFEKIGALGGHYSELTGSCSTCLFSGYISDFEISYTIKEKKIILLLLEKFKSLEIGEAMECRISAEIQLLLRKKTLDDIAYIFLVGSYLEKHNLNSDELRIELQCDAIDTLEKAIKMNEYDSNGKLPIINYLIGELYRRTSDFENAKIYFDKTLKNENSKEWVLKYATSQKELAEIGNNDNSI